MGESERLLMSYQEIAEALVKQKGIHEGIWGIYVEFGIGAANIQHPQDPKGKIVPAAIVPAVKMGIQEFPEENSLTVDAAKVNPRHKGSKTTVVERIPKKRGRGSKMVSADLK